MPWLLAATAGAQIHELSDELRREALDREARGPVPMGMAAGIGRKGPYHEQGNIYRGGVLQLPMVASLYGEQNLLRPAFSPELTREQRIRVSRYYDLKPDMPAVDWEKASRHLPVADMITAAGGPPGSFDQRPVKARQDVLVYTSAPLEEDLEVSGPVEVVLYVSPNARDTDFTAKLVDVETEDTAWNLDETIQRARYREVFLQDGQMVELRPMATSNVFQAGHRIRLEVSSRNFPRFARNFNDGGNNARATKAVVAANAVHHGADSPSGIVLTTVPR